jgi:hypothetical protein
LCVSGWLSCHFVIHFVNFENNVGLGFSYEYDFVLES